MDHADSRSYYCGLPSNPRLLASTRPAQDLVAPPSMGYTIRKHIYPIEVEHSISRLWDSSIVPYIADLFGVHYPDGNMCLDAVRIGYNKEDAVTIVWIGLPEDAISIETAVGIVATIKESCLEMGASNFEVEIRTAFVRRLGKFLDPTSLPAAALPDLIDDFCCTLGTPISTDVHPDVIGTGGLLVRLPGQKNLFMTSAQHVVEFDHQAILRPSDDDQHRKSLILHTPYTFLKHRKAVASTIEALTDSVQKYKDSIERAEERERSTTFLMESLGVVEKSLHRATEWMNRLDSEYGNGDKRTFGRTYAYPGVHYNTDPVDTGRTSSYTEDWSLIETNIEDGTENVNSLNLMDIKDRVSAMRFPEQLPKLTTDDTNCLRVNGCLSQNDLLSGSIAVLKKGASTSLTLGVTNGVHSYWRNTTAWSKEVAVINMDEDDLKPFSTGGDSGSIVIDRSGRICGILHAGCERTKELLREDGSAYPALVDISYIAPWWWVVERMRKSGLNPTVV
jgi:hypothetical protein